MCGGGDITYISTDEGWLFLAVVIDLFSRQVVGWSLRSDMTRDIVIDALRMAWFKRHPGKHAGLIFHSDRGSQYTSNAVMGLLKKYGIKQSFSRVGMPGDNAWSESFFANLKKEQVHWRQYKTVEEARDSIFEYIEVFYNRRRVQKRLGYLSPLQWLKQWQQLNSELVA